MAYKYMTKGQGRQAWWQAFMETIDFDPYPGCTQFVNNSVNKDCGALWDTWEQLEPDPVYPDSMVPIGDSTWSTAHDDDPVLVSTCVMYGADGRVVGRGGLACADTARYLIYTGLYDQDDELLERIRNVVTWSITTRIPEIASTYFPESVPHVTQVTDAVLAGDKATVEPLIEQWISPYIHAWNLNGMQQLANPVAKVELCRDFAKAMIYKITASCCYAMASNDVHYLTDVAGHVGPYPYGGYGYYASCVNLLSSVPNMMNPANLQAGGSNGMGPYQMREVQTYNYAHLFKYMFDHDDAQFHPGYTAFTGIFSPPGPPNPVFL